LQDTSVFPPLTPETGIIFLFSNFMYIFSFIAFSISKPWKKEFYTNIRFMIALTCVFTYSSLIVVVPAARFSLLQIFGMTNKVVTLYAKLKRAYPDK
jgi:hypothetical protein